jgi:hypothetical protein
MIQKDDKKISTFDIRNDLQKLLPPELYSAMMDRFSISDQKINELVDRQNPEHKIVINYIRGSSIYCDIIGKYSRMDGLIYIEGKKPFEVLQEIDAKCSFCDNSTLLDFTELGLPLGQNHGIPDDPWEMKLADSEFAIGLDVPMNSELTRIIGISIVKEEGIAYISIDGGYGELSAVGIDDERVETSINAIDGLSYYGEESHFLVVKCDKKHPFSQLMSKLNGCLEQLLPSQE